LRPVRVLLIGIGSLGIKLATNIINKNNLKLIGAIDNDQSKVGKDIGELCGIGNTGIKVSSSLKKILKYRKPDVAILTTTSSIKEITSQIEEIMPYGIQILTTCEELTFPWLTYPSLAREIDRKAKEYDISILSTGINPGFLMDLLPIQLTAVCQKVSAIKVYRYIDAAYRRSSFQKKIGTGLTVEEFKKRIDSNQMGHIGLRESMYMIARTLGWKIDSINTTIDPIITESEIKVGAIRINANRVIGIQQICKGYVKDKEKITLTFRASIGEKEPRDRIEIYGIPDVKSIIKGGINGDVGTCSLIINSISRIMNANPGLLTMVDMPIVSYKNDY